MCACRNRSQAWLSVGLLTLTLAAGAAHACKYNVRDAGFVDFEPAPYRLLVVTNETTPADWREQLRHVAAVSLLDANVELVLSREETGEPRMDAGGEAALDTQEAMSFRAASSPSAFLLGPDGRRLGRPVPAGLDQAAAWSLVEQTATSPLRQRLLDSLVLHFAVILVAGGSDAAQGERARKSADGAVERFRERMPRLPKPVKSPPLALSVTGPGEPAASTAPADLVATDVDWWALEMEDAPADEAHVVVLYGRGRRAGPVLRGSEITETAILEVLTILGQDCECDLDRSWLRGPLLPLRWDEARQREVVRELGFDAENPMVKAEISRIVARGPGTGTRQVRFDDGGGGFADLGYAEISLEGPPAADLTSEAPPLASDATEGETRAAQNTNPPVAAPAVATTTTATPAQRPVARMSFMVLILIAVVALGVALVFLFSGKSD